MYKIQYQSRDGLWHDSTTATDEANALKAALRLSRSRRAYDVRVLNLGGDVAYRPPKFQASPIRITRKLRKHLCLLARVPMNALRDLFPALDRRNLPRD